MAKKFFISCHQNLADLIDEILEDPRIGMIPDPRKIAHYIREISSFSVLGDFRKERDRSEAAITAAVAISVTRDHYGIEPEDHERALHRASDFLEAVNETFSMLINANDLKALSDNDRERFCRILAAHPWQQINELLQWDPDDEKLPLDDAEEEGAQAEAAATEAPADAEGQP